VRTRCGVRWRGHCALAGGRGRRALCFVMRAAQCCVLRDVCCVMCAASLLRPVRGHTRGCLLVGELITREGGAYLVVAVVVFQ
jgi:hypothetical protein